LHQLECVLYKSALLFSIGVGNVVKKIASRITKPCG
jgi:hypothetical protein